jgi:hypothetical protein
MLESLRVKNVGPAPEMVMDMAPRLNIITGDNSLGKSFLLDVIWWALTRRWPQEVNKNLTSGYAARPTDRKQKATIEFALTSKTKSIAYESTYSPRDAAWIGRAGRPWNPGLVIHAHADGGFSVWDPARNYWRTKGMVDVQERLPAYVFSPKEVWDGLESDMGGSTPTIVCNGLVRDWASWIRENGKDADNMATLLKRLSVSNDPVDVLRAGPLTRISIDDARDIPSIRTPYSDAVPILYASAGIRRIVALAYMLLWSWKEHRLAARQLGETKTRQVVMLVDELESHLHPRWQRSILDALLKIVQVLHKQATIQLITATHSPLVLASTEPFFDPKKDAWFDLDLERAGKAASVKLSRRDYVRHGDISNWLTSEAFDLKSARSLASEEAIEKARELLRRNHPPTVKEAQAVDKLLREAALPDIDPFWVRWGAFIESLGQGK